MTFIIGAVSFSLFRNRIAFNKIEVHFEGKFPVVSRVNFRA